MTPALVMGAEPFKNIGEFLVGPAEVVVYPADSHRGFIRIIPAKALKELKSLCIRQKTLSDGCTQ